MLRKLITHNRMFKCKSMQVHFDSIKIQQISGNSGVFVGSNLQLNWCSKTKINSALGTVIGSHNLLQANMNVIYDNDVIDMPGQMGNQSNV